MRSFSLSARLGLLSATAILLFGHAAVAAETAGQIFLVVGDVTVVSVDGAKRTATKGSELFEGDRIQTAENGLAQVTLSDGGRLSIRSGSELVLSTYKYKKEEGGAKAEGNFVLSLLKGGFRSITGLIAKANPDAYKIQTPTATIGVRGTDHEPFFIPEPKVGETPIAPPGTYDKVNSGQTFLRSNVGQIDIKPGQVAFTPIKVERPPQILPKIPDFYAEPPTKGGKYLPLASRAKEGDDKGVKRDEDKAARLPTKEGEEKTVRTLDPATLKLITTEELAAPRTVLTTTTLEPTKETLVAPTTEIRTVTPVPVDSVKLQPTTTITPTTTTTKATITPTTTTTTTRTLSTSTMTVK